MHTLAEVRPAGRTLRLVRVASKIRSLPEVYPAPACLRKDMVAARLFRGTRTRTMSVRQN